MQQTVFFKFTRSAARLPRPAGAGQSRRGRLHAMLLLRFAPCFCCNDSSFVLFHFIFRKNGILCTGSLFIMMISLSQIFLKLAYFCIVSILLESLFFCLFFSKIFLDYFFFNFLLVFYIFLSLPFFKYILFFRNFWPFLMNFNF